MLCVVALTSVVAGCSTLMSGSSDSIDLEGVWIGAETSQGRNSCKSTFAEEQFNVDIGGGKETYKGTFVTDATTTPISLTLSITESSVPQFAGQTAYGICKVEGKTLSVAFCQPGLNMRPVSFTVSMGIRAFEGDKQ